MAYNRNKKQENDKFYTKPEAVDSVLSKLDLDSFETVIEPSAGNGSFTRKISHRNTLSLDIEPEAEGIVRQDWLLFDGSALTGRTLVVGNPPFGNQGGLAMKFIKKAAEIGADTIAFILPKSFKKDSVKNKIPLAYHLATEMDLDDDSFTLEGAGYKVPCVFQVWERRAQDRTKKVIRTKTHLFDFVKKDQPHDIAFRRVGFYAGRHYLESEDKSEQSHYFIRSAIPLDELTSLLGSLVWEHNNTAGPRSISKGELVERAELEYGLVGK